MVSLGNLTLSVQTTGLEKLTELENRLVQLNTTFGQPLKINVDASAATGGVAAYVKVTQTAIQANRALSESEAALARDLQQSVQQRQQAVQLERVAAGERVGMARVAAQQQIADARALAAQQLQTQRATDAQQLQAQRASDALLVQNRRATDAQLAQAQRTADATQLASVRATNAQTIQTQRANDAQLVQSQRASAATALQTQRASDQQRLQSMRSTDQLALAQQRASDQQLLADKRGALAQQLEAQRAYDNQRLQAQRAADRQQAASQRGGDRGFLSGVMSGTSLGQGVAFGAGAFVGSQVMQGAQAGVKGLSDSIIGLNALMEQAQTRFTALLGSAGAAREMLAGIDEIARHSTFGRAQLQDAGASLLAYGVHANQLLTVLKAVQTAAVLSGQDQHDVFQRLGIEIGQLSSGIKPTERDLRELANAGVPITRLAQALGTTSDELQKLGTSGKYSGAQIVEAFEKVYTSGQIGDLMAKQANTFTGAMNILKTNISAFLAEAGRPLFDVVEKLAARFAQLAQSGQLQSWARSVAAAVQSLINLFERLFAVVTAVARVMLALVGVKLPSLGSVLAPRAPPTSGPRDDLGGQTAPAGAQGPSAAEDNDAKLTAVRHQIALLKDQQDALNDSISDTKQHYEDLITPLQRQLDALNRITDVEKERQQKLDELTGKEIAIKLAIPYDEIATLDKQIDDLKRKKDDLGRFDPTNYDNLIRPLEAQSKAYEKTIQGLQDQIDDLGEANTKKLDDRMKEIQRTMNDIGRDRTLERRIQDLQAILNKPAPDTSNLNNQMIALASGMAGANPQMQQMLATQYGDLSRQKVAILETDRQARLGAQTELEQLQDTQRLQQRTDEDHRDALQNELESLQEQRQTIQDTHDAAVKGLRDQIKEQERLKRAVDEQANVWKQAKQDAEQAFQQQVQALDDQIKKLERQRDDLKKPSDDALKQVDAEKNILQLQQQQDDLRRKMLEQPLKEQIDDLKQAEQDALDPLERRSKELDKQMHALEAQQRSLQAIKDELDAGGGGGGGAPDVQLPDAGAFDTSKLVEGTNKVSEAIDNLTANIDKLTTFINEHVVPAAEKVHNWLVTIKDDVIDLYNWLEPKLRTAFDTVRTSGEKLTDWLSKTANPLLQDQKDIANALLPVLRDLSNIFSPTLKLSLGEWSKGMQAQNILLQSQADMVDKVLRPVLVGLSDLIKESLVGNLNMWHDILNDKVIPALDDLHDKIAKTAQPAIETITEKVGEFITKLSDLKTWVEQNMQGVGEKLSKPFSEAWDKIKDFFGDLSRGINWLAEHFGLKSIPAPQFGTAGATTAPPSVGTGVNVPTGGSGPKSQSGRINADVDHWSWVGEQGPELMFVPRGASILPHGMSTQIANHADGFNVDAIFGPLGAVVPGSAGRFVDTLMGKLSMPTVPGLPEAGAALIDQITKGLMNWLKDAPGNIVKKLLTGGLNIPGMWHHFSDLSFDNYMRVLGSYPSSPIGDNADFATLIGVAKEVNIDPRFLMAIMQTESGYGQNAGLIGRFFNYIGMGVNDRGWSFDSGIHATDGGPEYAGYASYHDMLEDLSAWLIENNGNVSGYQTADQGQGKANAYASILALTGGAPAGSAYGNGGYQDALQAAAGMLGETFHDGHAWDFWCEQFVETVDRAAGYTIPRYTDAWTHATSVNLQGGAPPSGASAFWSPGNGWSQYGHTAIAVGDGTFITTSPQGIVQTGTGWLNSGNYAGWAPPGLANGGISIGGNPRVVVVGDGPAGEREFHTPEPELRRIVHEEANTTVHLQPGSVVINVGERDDPRKAGADAWDGFLTRMYESGRIPRK